MHQNRVYVGAMRHRTPAEHMIRAALNLRQARGCIESAISTMNELNLEVPLALLGVARILAATEKTLEEPVAPPAVAKALLLRPDTTCPHCGGDSASQELRAGHTPDHVWLHHKCEGCRKDWQERYSLVPIREITGRPNVLMLEPVDGWTTMKLKYPLAFLDLKKKTAALSSDAETLFARLQHEAQINLHRAP